MKSSKISILNRKKKAMDLPLGYNVTINIIIALFCLSCVIPFLFIIIISFTDEMFIIENGYTFFPKVLSLNAYRYISEAGSQLFQSYGITIFTTVAGTMLSLIVIGFYSYAISRKEFKFRKFFTFMCFFTMLFNGGMVPTYIVMTQLLHLKDTIWALILPLMVNAWFILILKTYFTMTVPDSLIDSARIDGAGEFRTFFQIVIPISLPGFATIALFNTLNYWNDWFQSLLYITDPSLTTLQYLLMKIENNMEFMINNASNLGGGESYLLLQNIPRSTTKMAMVVLCTGPIILAYPFFQRFFIKGLTVGAIKG